MSRLASQTRPRGFLFFSFLPRQESHMAYRYNYSFYENHSESTSFNITSEEQITASINIYCWQDWLHISCVKGRRWSCPDVAPPAQLLPMEGTGPTSGFWTR